MNTRPFSVSAMLVFILLNALVWLGFGLIIAANLHPALPDSPFIKGIMAFLSLVAAGILVGLFVLLSKRIRIIYFLAVAFFIAVSLLTILDDFGLVDLVILAINVVPLILLIKDRAWYLQQNTGIVERGNV